MKIENTFFNNNKSQKLSARIYSGDHISENGLIYCHGMLSSKDGHKVTSMAETIVNAGLTLLTFDFSFSGESDGDLSELSILQEVDDLNAAFFFFKKYGVKNIHIAGSSLGGLVTFLFSSVMGDRVASQSLIATPVLIPEMMSSLAGADINDIPEDGFTKVDGISIHNKFFKEALVIDIVGALAKTSVPALIMHGGMDTAVPLANASVLIKNLACKKRMVLIEDGDHHLGRDSDIKILSGNIIEWVSEHSI